MLLVNFSHPLHSEAKQVLLEQYGITEIIQVPFHLDMNQNIVPQVIEIALQVTRQHGQPHYIILPGFAPAAALIARLFPNSRLVRLAATGNPPKWMPVEIITIGG